MYVAHYAFFCSMYFARLRYLNWFLYEYIDMDTYSFNNSLFS